MRYTIQCNAGFSACSSRHLVLSAFLVELEAADVVLPRSGCGITEIMKLHFEKALVKE